MRRDRDRNDRHSERGGAGGREAKSLRLEDVTAAPALLKSRLFLILASLLLATLALPALAQFELAGETITRVQYRADGPIDQERLDSLNPLKAGTALSVRNLQNAIENLYSTGDFRDVRVDATRGAAGLDITIVLSLAYRVGGITFEGTDGQTATANRELAIRTGEVLSLNAVDRSAVSIQDALADRGFIESTVDPETRFDRATSTADVIFHVTLGPRATIGAIAIEGETAPFTEQQILGAMKRKPGDVFVPAEATDDEERIRRFLVRQGRRRANVRYLGHTYDAAANRADLRFLVVTGPMVRVEVVGVPRRSVRRLIPFRRDEAYSEDLIERAADEIVRTFQQRGYFLAAVATDERMTGDELVVTYEISPGKRYRLDEVKFEGNQKISDDTLRGVVATAPIGGFRRTIANLFRRPTGVTQEQLNADQESLQAFYQLEGFTQAEARTPVATPAADGTLDVTFPITEGPQTIVGAIRFEGAQELDPKNFPTRLLREGQPLNPLLLNEDRVSLASFYANRGYAEIQVSPRITFTPDRTGADITYTITEGPRVTIDEVVVRGNTYTKDEVILRRAGLRTGQPFSLRAILEAQRELYRLATFQRVDILPEQAGAAVSERDVVIQVEEGRNLTVAGAVGYSTEHGFRGTATVSHRNLFGTGRYLGLEGRIAQGREGREEDRFFLTYREPFTFGYDVPIQVTVYEWDEGRPEARFQRIGTFVEASRVIQERTRLSLRYEYKVAECVQGIRCEAATGEIPIPGIPREDQEIEISSITPSAFWDTRDDPLNPTRGWFASSALEYAFPLYRAETNFIKAFEQGAWYRPLSRRSMLAVSARLGLIEPLRESGPGSFVPFSERFFGGGETTHRAFDLDELGIEGETLVCVEETETVPCTRDRNPIALGGNGMLMINAEYRFPIFSSVGGAVFVDAGNIWRDMRDIDLGEIRYGAGVGVRYVTPVGPLRADIGFKLDRKPYESPYAFFLTLGFPF